MKHLHFISCILFLLILNSCKRNDYEVLNDFIKMNKIQIFNLQKEPICFKELYLTSEEVKSLNIKIENDKCLQQNQIDIKEITFNNVIDRSISIKTRLSFPIFSNDKKYMYIIVQTYEENNINFLKTEIVYKLLKVNKKWKIIDTFKNVTQS